MLDFSILYIQVFSIIMSKTACKLLHNYIYREVFKMWKHEKCQGIIFFRKFIPFSLLSYRFVFHIEIKSISLCNGPGCLLCIHPSKSSAFFKKPYFLFTKIIHQCCEIYLIIIQYTLILFERKWLAYFFKESNKTFLQSKQYVFRYILWSLIW